MRILTLVGLLVAVGCETERTGDKGGGRPGEGAGNPPGPGNQPGGGQPGGGGEPGGGGGGGGAGGEPGGGKPQADQFVFVMTNDAKDNQIVALRQEGDDLVYTSATSTAGKGLGTKALPSLEMGNGVDPLVSEGALSRVGDFLLAVNAGSGSVSSLEVAEDGTVELMDTIDVGGYPTTVVGRGDRVFVGVGAGPEATGAGVMPLRLDKSGMMTSDGAMLPLSAPSAHPTRVLITEDAGFLIATEVLQDTIDVWPLDKDMMAGAVKRNAAQGPGPFGVVSLGNDRILVADAIGAAGGKSTVSSYDIATNGMLSPITRSLANGQMGTCWLAIDKDRKLAVSTNAGSNTLTSYDIDDDGMVTIREKVVDTLPSPPTDLRFDPDARSLYVLLAEKGEVARYDVAEDGTLTPRGVATDLMLPEGGAQGLVVW